MDDDEPRAVQAILRCLHTFEQTMIYRPHDPLFSDVEWDLDFFVIADKDDLQPLKVFTNNQLVLFYETGQRPSLDPKGWSAKNQVGLGNVLWKLYRLDIDTMDLRKAARQLRVSLCEVSVGL